MVTAIENYSVLLLFVSILLLFVLFVLAIWVSEPRNKIERFKREVFRWWLDRFFYLVAGSWAALEITRVLFLVAPFWLSEEAGIVFIFLLTAAFLRFTSCAYPKMSSTA